MPRLRLARRAWVPTTLLFATQLFASPLPPATPPTDDEMLNFLTTYCARCHGGDRPAHDLPLDTLENAAAAAEKAKTALSENSMPPTRARPKPTADERAAMVLWFEAAIPPTH